MAYQTIGSQQSSWAAHSYENIKSIAEQSGSILVLPVGSIEQHGPHLSVATDIVCADAIARNAAEHVHEKIPILVIPPVWMGVSPHHLNLGGTLSLNFETMLTLLQDIIETGIGNGFDAVLLINGHGGNRSVLSGVAKTVGHKYHPDVEVLTLTYFGLAEDIVAEVRDSEVGGMNHGGELETSLMMHLRPDLVNEDRISGRYLNEPYTHGYDGMFEGGPLSVYRSEEEYSETGAVGAPEVASAEKGEQIFDAVVSELVTILNEIHNHNRETSEK